MVDKLDFWRLYNNPKSNYRTLVQYDGDGVTQHFEFNFSGGYIDKKHILCALMDLSDGTTSPASFSWVGANRIMLQAPLADGFRLIIFRDTPKDMPLAKFQDGAIVSEKNLDRNAMQAIFAVAEMVDRFDNTFDKSQEALEVALSINSKAETALANSTEALNIANGIDAKVTQALTNAAEALSTADNALTVANGIDAKATDALEKAAHALDIQSEMTDELETRLYSGKKPHSVDLSKGSVSIPSGTGVIAVISSVVNSNLVLWGTHPLPYTISSIKANSYNGYDLVTDKGTFEAVTKEVCLQRHGSLDGKGTPTPHVDGWGAQTDKDSTVAFKKAIEYARKFNTHIRVGAGNFIINERLFFGPLNDADLATPSGYPVNICTGIKGDNVASTIITPGPGLAGDIVIDMTGLRDKVLHDLSILVMSEANCPAVGILTARFRRNNGSVTNNDLGEFRNIRVTKYFSMAAYFAASTEEIYVLNGTFRTDHNDAQGAFVSTADLKSVWPTVKEAKETKMLFTVGRVSNLHQSHVNCDYYLGSNSPTKDNAGMIYIKDSLMVNIEGPFFNNNTYLHDCVVVDASPDTAYVYGIHLRNANFHQNVRSGMRLKAATTNCSLQCSSGTHNFSEGALIIERYTNGFFSSWLPGDLRVTAGGMENSQITSCRNFIWSEKATIEGSFVGVRGNIITDPTDKVATNNFQINHKGKLYRIVGFYGVPSEGALNIQANKRSTDNLVLSSKYHLFDGAMLKVDVNETASEFDFIKLVYKNTPLLRIDKQGSVVLEGTNSIIMKDTSGNMRRMVYNSDGSVTASKI